MYGNVTADSPRRVNISIRETVSRPTTNLSSDPHTQHSQNANLRLAFPCLHPANVHMASEDARVNSFFRNSNWPQSRINATIRQLVAAGLFYTGESDRVKCWYCDGGLQNWQRDDVPWIEHAKWYPTCEYLLQQKGPEYVHRIVSQYPNLQRPVRILQRNIFIGNEPLREVESRTEYGRQSSSVEIIDPRQESRDRDERINTEMNSDISARAEEMGFESGEIRAAIRRQIEANHESFLNLETLVDAIINLPSTSGQQEAVRHAAENDPPPLDLENIESISATAGAREIRRIEESRRCKSCRNAQACMVFIPCGHLVCCVDCGREVSVCPLCQSQINERVRSYIV